MDAKPGVAPVEDQVQAPSFVPNQAPNNPNTPNTPVARRTSNPTVLESPKPSPNLRRTTSATGLNDHSAASPTLAHRSSRASLGAHLEDGERRLTPKRSISNLISGLRDAQAKMDSIEEPVPLTASQIAIEHFEKELNRQSGSESTAEVVVILHDACYGHRYSRPKTSKTTLSMIVERPERILASVLGASTAYVRLGGHYAGAKNAPHPDKVIASSPPFKIRRTARFMDITSPYVTNVHGTAWMAELRSLCHGAGNKLAAGAKELSRSSTPTEPNKRKLHEGDLYLCPESLNAFQGALGGVADAVDSVFSSPATTKRAFVAIRPPGHHCSADYPSGFCWLNNVHVGIEYAAQTYGLTHAVILDFDLHHGDGSQAITWQRNSSNNVKRLNAKPNSKLKLGPDIGYYSLHDINSYPCEMGDDEKVQAASLCIENAHGQNIWNVHLQPWKTEKDFWELYDTRYRVLLDKARQFLCDHTSRLKAEGKVVPKAAVFISAGFDASEWESAGMQRHKVNVPTEFYARFTRDVVELAEQVETGCSGRVISVLEGGYSDRALCSGVLSHLSGLCATPVEAAFKPESSAMDGLDQMMRGLGINGSDKSESFYYNKAWWSPANLTALEMKVNPPPPPQMKKTRIGQQPTYATPTESFAYKVVDANKFARSISGTMREVHQPARPPTPPPPEVEWVVATQELSKLLIPSDRQTKSCTSEELAAPKAKKDLGSALATLTSVDSGKSRQLRDRKAKAPEYGESSHVDELESTRSASRSSRRQTIAELPSSSGQTEPSHQRRASRRLSAGSALSSIAGDIDADAPVVPVVPKTSSRTTNAMPPPAVTAQGVQVKKTRAPAKTEATPSAPASPKRSSKLPARFSGVGSNTAQSTNNDVDALAAGMKRVTLKVGTKEEHERKQKEKIDAERRARALKAAETRKANAAAKKTVRASIAPVSKPGFEDTGQLAKENTAPLLKSPEGDSIDHATHLTLPAVETINQANPSIRERNSDSYSITSLPEEVNGQTISVASNGTHSIAYGQQETKQDIPPMALHSMPVEQPFATQQPFHMNREILQEAVINNTSLQDISGQTITYPTSLPHVNLSPVAARSPSGIDMPVWSSTGAIPFATANGKPKEPSTFAQGEIELAQNVGWVGDGNITANPGKEVDPVQSTSTIKSEEKKASIWDVPDTPRG